MKSDKETGDKEKTKPEIDESYQKITADNLFPPRPEGSTIERQLWERTFLRRVTLLYRQISVNQDLLILAVIIVLFSYFGYSLSHGFSFGGVAKTALILLAGVVVIFWSIHIPAGKISCLLTVRLKSGKSRVLSRIAENRDLVILFLIIVLAVCFGYFLSLGFGWKTIAKLVLVFLTGVVAVVWKLHTPSGKIATLCFNKGNKKADEIDSWGRSINAK